VRLDGARADHEVVDTARGREVRVDAGDTPGPHVLQITLR
jgi:hypothetical protein